MGRGIFRSIFKFELERFSYPLVNADKKFRLENIVAILFQPLFLLIDLFTLPYILAHERDTRVPVVDPLDQCSHMTSSILGAIPSLLGLRLHQILIAIIREPDVGVAGDIIKDPNRRFWYAYCEYYMVICEMNAGMREF